MFKHKTAILLIRLTNSNILFTLSNLDGQILISISAGQFKTNGTKKTTLNSVKASFFSLNRYLKPHYKLHLKLKGLGKHKRLILKLITKNLTVPIISFCDTTVLPHNGVKASRTRRI